MLAAACMSYTKRHGLGDRVTGRNGRMGFITGEILIARMKNKSPEWETNWAYSWKGNLDANHRTVSLFVKRNYQSELELNFW